MEKDQVQKPVEEQPSSTSTPAPAENSQEATKAPASSEDTKQTGEAAEPTPAPETSSKDAETPAKPAETKDDDRIEEVKGNAAAEPKSQATETESKPEDTRPAYLSKNPALSAFFEKLPKILKATGHNEMWGVSLKDSDDIPTVNILIKFLHANEGNLKEAEDQLTKALEWRKTMKPLELVENASFPKDKFNGLGYVTTYNDPKSGKAIFTWNIYGSVKDIDATFGNLDEFIKWRVVLMELAIKELKLGEATTVIEYNGEDPYQMFQVHDYLNVSFLRMNPTIRNASRQTIEVFSMAYPELLKEKFFVNVPVVMGWVFTALKVFLSKKTTRKFHPITNGVNLAREFNGVGKDLPAAYGGKAGDLAETGQAVRLHDEKPKAPATETTPESAEPQDKPANGTAEAPAEKSAEPAPAELSTSAEKAPEASAPAPVPGAEAEKEVVKPEETQTK